MQDGSHDAEHADSPSGGAQLGPQDARQALQKAVPCRKHACSTAPSDCRTPLMSTIADCCSKAPPACCIPPTSTTSDRNLAHVALCLLHPTGQQPTSPFSAAGYTGFCAGLSETYAKTPVPAQLMAKVPPSDTYLFTRTQVPPVTTPTRDPCNFPETYKPRHEAVNLWASLQTKGESKADREPALGHTHAPGRAGCPGSHDRCMCCAYQPQLGPLPALELCCLQLTCL